MQYITDPNDKNAKWSAWQAEAIANKDRQALLSLLHSANGRWFLMRLLDKTKLNAEVFTGNSNTFFNEGKRAVGLGILTEIHAIGLDAIKLKQKAELEYAKMQMQTRQDYLDYVKKGENE